MLVLSQNNNFAVAVETILVREKRRHNGTGRINWYIVCLRDVRLIVGYVDRFYSYSHRIILNSLERRLDTANTLSIIIGIEV